MFSEEELKSNAGAATAAPEPAEEFAQPPSSPAASNDDTALLESLGSPSPVTPGEIVPARVLQVTESEVLLDVGVKFEVAVPRAEFAAEDGQVNVAPGDAVDVVIESYDEEAGKVTVSRRKAAHQRAWEAIERALEHAGTLTGRVLDRVKGGLTVDVGVRAFLPGSHADIRPHSNLDALKGQEITCRVIKFNRKRENVVVSRRLALEEETARRKAELAERLVEGSEVVGRVKNLTDYGAFVDLGGIDGLLHVTDLAWGRVAHPSEVVQPGQELRVKVLKYDREKGRVSLGVKQLTPDPWERVPQTYGAGVRFVGNVVSVTDYGAFVELEPGVEGLVHISEMTWSTRMRHPSKIVGKGDRVEVAVLDVNPAQRRISLSLKHTQPDPWKDLAERFRVGDTVEGRIRNMTEFGAFVEVEDGVEGLVHLSNLSWNKNVKHASEVLKKGQKVAAVVLALDTANRRLSLGLKQLQPDIWSGFFEKTKVDDVLRGKVTRVAPFGVFVELQEGIEGLCHKSEFTEEGGGPDAPAMGSERDFRVVRLDPAGKKIALSCKLAAQPSSSRQEHKEKEPARTSTMADALSSAGVTAAGLISAVPPELAKDAGEGKPQV